MVSEVYIKIDEHNNIVRVEGGASQSLVGEDWIKVDEGVGDRYYLCQNNYLEKSIFVPPYGIYRYAYINGEIVEKDITEEIAMVEARREAEAEISRLKAYLSDTDYVVTKMSEALALGEDTTSLVNEYREVISERAEARRRINELEG